MYRVLKIGYVAVTALLVGTFVFSQGAPREPAKPEAKTDGPLFARLDKVVTFAGLDDPKTTLTDALDLLAKQYNIVFDINEKAFKTEGVADVAKTQPAESSPIPTMKDVRLETVLRKILSRIPSQSNATFTVRRDHIEITTTKAQQDEFWPNAPAEMEPVFPLVHAKFDKKPLDEALAELSDRTDISIVLDVKVAEKDKPVVTARLTNTPLDTAVQLLAEMCDLRSVVTGKTIFVTSAEKAKRLEKQMNPPAPFGMPGGPGFPCFIGAIGQIGAFGAIGGLPNPLGGQLGFGGTTGTPPVPPGFRPRSNPGAGM
jgi:hypothetical protein